MIGQISIANLKRIQKIYYHGDCPDGIGARTILQKIFASDVQYVPYYFEDLKEIPSYALFIDCAPQPHQIKEILEKGGCIAEHHGSRLAELLELRKDHPQQIVYGEGIESGSWIALEIYKLLNNCGSVSPALEEMASLLAIGDTWKKDDPNFPRARKLANYIRFFGNDFSLTLEELRKLELEGIIDEFDAVQQRQHQTRVDRALIRPLLFYESEKIAFINDSELNISAASEHLRQKGVNVTVGFTVKIFEGVESIQYSLRSKKGVFDSGSFAKAMAADGYARSGGGHELAAGFTVDYQIGKDPINHFLELLATAGKYNESNLWVRPWEPGATS